MFEATIAEPIHRRPHTPPVNARYAEIDLGRELAALHGEPGWERGRNAKTLFKSDDCRIVLNALRAQASIPEHATDAPVTIQALAGRVQMRADGRTFDMRAGSLLTLEAGVPHEVVALEDSAILITVVWAKVRS